MQQSATTGAPERAGERELCRLNTMLARCRANSPSSSLEAQPGLSNPRDTVGSGSARARLVACPFSSPKVGSPRLECARSLRAPTRRPGNDDDDDDCCCCYYLLSAAASLAGHHNNNRPRLLGVSWPRCLWSRPLWAPRMCIIYSNFMNPPPARRSLWLGLAGAGRPAERE